MQNALDTMRFMRTHPTAHGSIELKWGLVDLHDAAWRSARDTGALGYMPYKEVQRDADLYGLQADVTEQMTHIVSQQMELLAPITIAPDENFSKIPESQFNDMLLQTATMQLDAATLVQFMHSLDETYRDLLKP